VLFSMLPPFLPSHIGQPRGGLSSQEPWLQSWDPGSWGPRLLGPTPPHTPEKRGLQGEQSPENQCARVLGTPQILKLLYVKWLSISSKPCSS
jgi:hypothetical protein